MIWLLKLYPSPWRRRYGDEVAGMIADRGFSLRIAIDLVAGAIDVWLHPSVTLAAAAAAQSKTTEEKTMLNRIARLGCGAAFGPDVTRADQWRATIVTIGGTIVLTLVWMAAHVRIGDNAYVDSLSVMPFMVPMLFSMRYTYLKGRPGSVQAVFIVGFSLLLAAFMLACGWIAAQI
jgi:hypothetical protein